MHSAAWVERFWDQRTHAFLTGPRAQPTAACQDRTCGWAALGPMVKPWALKFSV